MSVPRYPVPLRVKPVVTPDGLQELQFNRFLDLISRGLWNKDYLGATDTSGSYQVTASPAVVSLLLSTITPYQVDTNIWKTDINICLTVAAAVRTGITLSLSGMKFKAVSGLFQPVTGYQFDGAFPVDFCHAVQNTGNIIIQHTSGSTETYGFKAEGLIMEQIPDFAEVSIL